MNYILFDDSSWENLLPLTFTRPVSDIRIGILKIFEKWETMLHTKTSFLTKDYLSNKFPLQISDENILINSSILPDNQLIEALLKLKEGEKLVHGETLIAAYCNKNEVSTFKHDKFSSSFCNKYEPPIIKINYPWDIFSLNENALLKDFEMITRGRTSANLSSTNRLAGEHIFIEDGAKVEFSILNTLTGPIYIGKDAEIMEGSVVRGSLALCEHSTLKLGAKIYGATTIGPHSKVGGEVNNSVILGYSSKAHDGFLGNSVLGEWCNLGADTNNSNLKNNYALVKVWNYPLEKFINTNLQFCGLIMGDHSKSGINTMFNTGTVVGVSSNIFGDGFPRNFIPSFSWGGAQGFTVFTLSKVFEVASQVMKRRNLELTDIDKSILSHIFEATEKFRRF